MRCSLPLVVCIGVAASAALAAPAPSEIGGTQAVYTSLTAASNGVGMTLTNYGFFGNNFVSRGASFEFPLGSGFDHMPRAGLWFGAVSPDSGFTSVSTGAVDGTTGSSSYGSTEFTPISNTISQRSSLSFSRYFSPSAVSEMDYLCSYTDRFPVRPSSATETSRPLGIDVSQSVYSWTTQDYGSVLFVRFVIRNIWGSPLTNAWVGMYTELASGSKNAYACWPPVSACGPGNWFAKSWLSYDEDLRLLREHYCAGSAVPGACNATSVPYWAGVQLLTPPLAGQNVTVAAWNWAPPGDTSRDQDVELYVLMSAGTIADVSPAAFPPTLSDPCELLAVGPFPSIAPGDSVRVDFAFVAGACGAGGTDSTAIREAAYIARVAQQADYPSTVVPTTAALLDARATSEHVTLRWHAAVSPGTAVHVQRRSAEAEWETLAAVEPSSAGEVVYEDRAVLPGQRWGYRLALSGAQGERLTPESCIDVPSLTSFGVRGVFPTPSRAAAAVVEFSLEQAGETWLESYDLHGRREARVLLGSLAGGSHAVALSRLGNMPPGLHLIRLAQGSRSAVTRALVIR